MKYHIGCDFTEVCHHDTRGEDGPWTGDAYYANTNHQWSVSKKHPGLFVYQTIETDIEDPLFVCILYSTGCTFSREDGCVQVLPGAIEPERKNSVYNAIRSLSDSEYFQYNSNNSKDNYDYLTKCIGEFCPSWIGYFESLEEVLFLDKNGVIQ